MVDNNIIRTNVAKAVKKCADMKLKTVALNFDMNYNYGAPAVLGAEIANYHFDKYKNKKDNRINELYLSNVDENLVNKAIVIADSMKLTRNLANEPAAFVHIQRESDAGAKGGNRHASSSSEMRLRPFPSAADCLYPLQVLERKSCHGPG